MKFYLYEAGTGMRIYVCGEKVKGKYIGICEKDCEIQIILDIEDPVQLALDQIELCKIPEICQSQFAKLISNFPFEDSTYLTEIGYFVSESLKDPAFFEKWYASKEFEEFPTEIVSGNSSKNGYCIIEHVIIEGKKYQIVETNDNLSFSEIVPQKKKEEPVDPKKEHARRCGRLAFKYGIRFSIVLKCFKGNEEKIKRFVDSFEKVKNKSCNLKELSLGRDRKRKELERLGIDISDVDPNYITPYITECLLAGELVK